MRFEWTYKLLGTLLILAFAGFLFMALRGAYRDYRSSENSFSHSFEDIRHGLELMKHRTTWEDRVDARNCLRVAISDLYREAAPRRSNAPTSGLTLSAFKIMVAVENVFKVAKDQIASNDLIVEAGEQEFKIDRAVLKALKLIEKASE